MERLRLAVDTGGTFTDLVLEDADRALRLFKSPTTPHDPIEGVLDAVDKAAGDLGLRREELLGATELFVHATTRAINAILVKGTARTALLVTRGHRDILLFREGGRTHPFDSSRPYPEPYIPRALTFEISERVGAGGEVVLPLDEDAVRHVLRILRKPKGVEAIAVCCLWSIVNPAHELRIGELIEEALPGMPYTLSHRLNPTIREYRRTAATAIDASLKPLMSRYLRELAARLEASGFGGRLLVVTSAGGMLDADDVAEAPIHTLKSGPSMAPVAGRWYAKVDAGSDTAVVADTGGTSYDVSLVRRNDIPFSRETWLGARYFSHMTGFPSVDVRSIGAGGGSIAWVDDGGVLQIGPHSAGAVPGPACYGKGGTDATVTDASLVLGHIDPRFFLGGDMVLDQDAAREAIATHIAGPLEYGVEEAAAAIVTLASEHMSRAIEDITLSQGIDPRGAVLVGGGGAAGLNAVEVARRLGLATVVIPGVGAVLSAAGALLSDLRQDFAAVQFTTSAAFDHAVVTTALARLEAEAQAFIAEAGEAALSSRVEFFVEARYPSQVWETEVRIPDTRLQTREAVDRLCDVFHAAHEELFAIADRQASVEFVTWRAQVSCRLRDEPSADAGIAHEGATRPTASSRLACFPETGRTAVPAYLASELEVGAVVSGPALIDSPLTTVVVNPGATVTRTRAGSLVIDPGQQGQRAAVAANQRVAAPMER